MKITVPDKTIEEVNNTGLKTGRIFNTFVFHAGLVLETKPQKSDTDSYLAHSIREKLDALGDKQELDMEKAEIAFLQDGMEHLRKSERLIGSGWYYLVDALRSAKDNHSQ